MYTYLHLYCTLGKGGGNLLKRSALEKTSAKVIGGNKVISALRRKGNILLILDVHA